MFFRDNVEDQTMKRANNRKDENAVSPVIAVILMVAITVVLAGVLYVWVTSLTDLGSERTPTSYFNLENMDELNSTVGQNLTMLSHRSGDKINWVDMRILISNDGETFSIINFEVEEPTLKVIMTKGTNIGKDTQFEVLERIYFKEGLGNWDPFNDFYLKIIHRPSKSTIFDSKVNLV